MPCVICEVCGYSLLSDWFELSLGMFTYNTIEQHAPARQQLGNVKSPLGSFAPRHYLGAKDNLHPGPRPEIYRLQTITTPASAGPLILFYQYGSNCAQGPGR